MTAVINEPIISATALSVLTDQASLAGALRFVVKAAPKRPTTQLQVLAGVLLEAENGLLTLQAFDYETALHQTITGFGSGRALVPAAILLDLIKGMSKGCHIELRLDGTNLVVTGDDITYKVPTLTLEDYPALPVSSNELVATLTAEQLARLQDVTSAAGKDDTLPVLTAVSIKDTVSGLEFSSTDRYRLAVYNPGLLSPFQGQLLVPADAIRLVAIAFKGKTVELAHESGSTFVTFIAGDQRATVRLVDGTFPDYRRLLPDCDHGSVTVDAKEFEKAVAQVAAVAARTAPIMVSGEGEGLTLNAGCTGSITAQKTISATKVGEPVTIAFNPGYLVDGIKALGSEKVQFVFATDDPYEAPRKPAIFITPGDRSFRYLLMPVRLAG